MKGITFSVLMSVYNGEKPEYLRDAMDSMLNQSVLPNQFVLVVDGFIRSDLKKVINTFERKFDDKGVSFRQVNLQENIGLGGALKVGIQYCDSTYILRMDSDDISVSDRIEKTIATILKNPGCSVYGGQIEEFKISPNDIERYRVVPEGHSEIKEYSKLRNPLNHVTVCINKKDLLDVGNYESVIYHEDYYLWLKFIMSGKKLLNVNDVWVYVRVGNDLVGRRKGWEYFTHEKTFVSKARTIGFFSKVDSVKYLSSRLLVRFLPKPALHLVYSRLRKCS